MKRLAQDLKKTSGLIIFLTVLLFLAVGCQQTPDEQAVVRRDNAEQIIMAASEEESAEEIESIVYEAPENVSESYFLDNNEIEVYINADVYIPDVDRFSVAEIEEGVFDQEKADALRAYLTDNQPLYYGYENTKSDYEAQIIAVMLELEQSEGVENDDNVNALKDWLEELKELQKEAPEVSSANEITDYSIDVDDSSGFMGYTSDGKELITIQPSSLAYYQGLWELPRDENISESINVNHMIDIAKEHLDEMGINGFEIVETASAYVYDSKVDAGVQEDSNKSPAIYFLFMRSYNHMMPRYLTQTNSYEGENYDYRPPFNPEVIEMILGENGEIDYFIWNNPIEITGELAQNVELLPFDHALDRLKQQLEYQLSVINPRGIDKISVTDIELYLNVIPIKNNPSKYMYVPCWYMTYSVYPNSDEIIIINAIDGASVAPSSSGWSEVG